MGRLGLTGVPLLRGSDAIDQWPKVYNSEKPCKKRVSDVPSKVPRPLSLSPGPLSSSPGAVELEAHGLHRIDARVHAGHVSVSTCS